MPPRLLVVAKAPVAGLVKTRLSPPATPVQAARMAAAALLDTLDAAAARNTVVALAGRLEECECADELSAALQARRVIAQRGEGLGERLAAAHADAGAGPEPLLQVGMDSPQLDAALVAEAGQALRRCDAVLGPATDGGFWALGLHDPAYAAVLRDVPMSTPRTGEATLRALRRLGLRVGLLPELDDVDDAADAVRVAGLVPHGRFAAAVRAIDAATAVDPA